MLFPLCWCWSWCYFLCVYVALFALVLIFILLGFVTLPTCYCCFSCVAIVILFSLVLFFSRWCYNFFQASVMVLFMLVHLMMVLYVVLYWCCYFSHIQDITLLVGLKYVMAQPNSYCWSFCVGATLVSLISKVFSPLLPCKVRMLSLEH